MLAIKSARHHLLHHAAARAAAIGGVARTTPRLLRVASYSSSSTSVAPLDAVVIGCYQRATPHTSSSSSEATTPSSSESKDTPTSSSTSTSLAPLSLDLLTATAFAVNDRTNNALFSQLEHANFSGRLGDVRVLYPLPDEDVADPTAVPARVAVVGLGPRPDSAAPKVPEHAAWEQARLATAVGIKALQETGAKRVGIETFADSPRAVAEGAVLAQYKFDHLKTAVAGAVSGNSGALGSTVTAGDTSPLDVYLLSRTGIPTNDTHTASTARPAPATTYTTGAAIAASQNFARHLMELPANLLTPRAFADTAAREMAGLPHVSVRVHDEAWVLARGMHAFHAVAKGSKEPLRFVAIEYRGRDVVGREVAAANNSDGTTADVDADNNASSTETAIEARAAHTDIVLVGKGVTFDAGGISIKPSAGMGMMKGDMGGAAVVLAVTQAAARLSLPINLVTLIPLCENMPSSSAVKPGDVVRAANGLTIEVDNTDAEGRLLLADALYHGVTAYRPRTAVIDVATLTGAMDVALGRAYTGVFATHTRLWDALDAAGRRAGDPVWRMPFHPTYLAAMQSSVADLKNAGDRSAGACTAAAFLYQFIRPAVPSKTALAVTADPSSGDWVGCSGTGAAWAHIDMAGVMHNPKAENAMSPAGMTGRPTRMLIEALRVLGESKKE
ncbi:cytosol aminopeptidase family, catalytic domain-containing protein [Blastocladiella britannica]|nr:cytosol aminopeptidase family, catalytic domain-containing protein [Blastocladiella britannica]